MSAELLFEDGEVAAAAKPAGQATIPGRGIPEEPLNRELERRLGRRLYVVHRLDREASGVVVFAKTPEAHRRLCADFESRRARKTYLAAVEGAVADAGAVDKPLRAFGSGRMGVAETGKPSLTRYRPVERLKGATLLEVDLVTGRRHQIRAHLFSIGHPILGDPLYGLKRPVAGAPRLMLHHLALSLPGLPPLRAEPPGDFVTILRTFRELGRIL